MKKLYLIVLLLITVYYSGFPQSAITDTASISTKSLIDAAVQKMTRELNLTSAQQTEIHNILQTRIEKENNFEFSYNSNDILSQLTAQQKTTYLQLLDIDAKASEATEIQREIMSYSTLNSGSVLTLSDAVHIKDVRLTKNNNPAGSHSENTNYSTFKRVSMRAWTDSGSPMFNRTVMRFILDEIPVGSQVTSAKLFLYSDPLETSSSSAEGNSQLSGSNAFYIESITEPWNDLTVTWNNQPLSTTDNRILVPASTSPTENIQIDLTAMVQTWVNTPNSNFGIKMFLQTETYYRARNYGSMEHENTAIRPRLVVNYSLPESNIEYTYDNSGNRTARQVVVIKNNALKSASVATNKEETENLAESVTSQWNDIVVSVFPNPTAGDLSIRFAGVLDSGNMTFYIYSANGVKITEGSINPTGLKTLPFSNLTKGIYILILKNGNDSMQWKIVKQ